MWEKFKKWRYAGSELSTVERREVLEELANTGTVSYFPGEEISILSDSQVYESLDTCSAFALIFGLKYQLEPVIFSRVNVC